MNSQYYNYATAERQNILYQKRDKKGWEMEKEEKETFKRSTHIHFTLDVRGGGNPAIHKSLYKCFVKIVKREIDESKAFSKSKY